MTQHSKYVHGSFHINVIRQIKNVETCDDVIKKFCNNNNYNNNKLVSTDLDTCRNKINLIQMDWTDKNICSSYKHFSKWHISLGFFPYLHSIFLYFISLFFLMREKKTISTTGKCCCTFPPMEVQPQHCERVWVCVDLATAGALCQVFAQKRVCRV